MPTPLFRTKLAAFFAGCAGTFLLRQHAGLGAVAASAWVGLLGTLLPSIGPLDRRRLHATLYAGTFAGMSSPELLGGPVGIFVVSLVGTVAYLLAKPHFVGIGGKLGAVAFVASLVLFLARSVA